MYLGTPSGKVRRLDRDEAGEHENLPSHPGTEISDSWGFEETWKKYFFEHILSERLNLAIAVKSSGSE